MIPGRYSSDGLGCGVAHKFSDQAKPCPRRREMGLMPLPSDATSVYEFLQTWEHTVNWKDNPLQKDFDSKAEGFEWPCPEMNQRLSHFAMAKHAQEKKHSNKGEVAWTDFATWDSQETVSSYFHVVGFLVAHGGRLMHDGYIGGKKKGPGTKGCQGFVNWDWDMVPSPCQPTLRGWDSSESRIKSSPPQPGEVKGLDDDTSEEPSPHRCRPSGSAN